MFDMFKVDTALEGRMTQWGDFSFNSGDNVTYLDGEISQLYGKNALSSYP